MTIGRGLAGAVLALATSEPANVAAAQRYRTAGDCDGFPRIAVVTPKGLCVGLVASGVGFIRGVAVIGSDVYVTDLGSRSPGRGRVLRLADHARGAPEVVLDRLDRPNGIVAAADGTLVIGEAGRVIRFSPRAPDPRGSVRVVLAGLPRDGLHLLTSLADAGGGALLVGVGSLSNNCEVAAGKPPARNVPCPEQVATPPRGAVLRFTPRAGVPFQAREIEVVARGLRNPGGLARLGDGTLLAVSNARDSIDEADARLADADLPHDTLVKLNDGSDFGWPYCYDLGVASPEYCGFDCATKTPPLGLLPAHAAPLALLEYRGTLLPSLQSRLLVAYHGYRARGHRLVALQMDRPAAPAIEVIGGWMARPGLRPQGAPTGLAVMADGSVLVTEDLNRGILRLSVERKIAPDG